MRAFNCIIIDDESKAIEVLTDTIKELYSDLTVSGTYTNWKEGLQALRRHDYDIVFLDISMPEKTGFDLLEFMSDIRAEIIFVTGHPQYAVDAFNYPAAGYILKPVEDIALNKAIDKAMARIEQKAVRQVEHRIAIPYNKGMDYIEQADIIYLEAMAKHTRIKTGTREFFSTQGLGAFKMLLSFPPFYQVHRSFIVNVKCIARYESVGILTMTNGTQIPVSKNMREDFLQRFSKQI